MAAANRSDGGKTPVGPAAGTVKLTFLPLLNILKVVQKPLISAMICGQSPDVFNLEFVNLTKPLRRLGQVVKEKVQRFGNLARRDLPIRFHGEAYQDAKCIIGETRDLHGGSYPDLAGHIKGICKNK